MLMQRSIVVLPEPLEPMMLITSPWRNRAIDALQHLDRAVAFVKMRISRRLVMGLRAYDGTRSCLDVTAKALDAVIDDEVEESLRRIAFEAHEGAGNHFLRPQSNSLTPMMESSVDALTISAAVLTQAGSACRKACGQAHRRGLRKGQTIALAASVCPFGIDCSAPAHQFADMRAAEDGEGQNTGLDGPRSMPIVLQDIVAREHQDEHRRAADEIGCNRARAI